MSHEELLAQANEQMFMRQINYLKERLNKLNKWVGDKQREGSLSYYEDIETNNQVDFERGN